MKNNFDIRIHSSNHGYAKFNFSVILYDDCHDDKGSGVHRDHLVWPWIKVEEQHGRVSGFQCQPSIALPELMARRLSKKIGKYSFFEQVRVALAFYSFLGVAIFLLVGLLVYNFVGGMGKMEENSEEEEEDMEEEDEDSK